MTTRVPAVGVIGTGAVGQAVSIALVASGVCGRLLVTSRTAGHAAALADDLDDMRTALGTPVRPAAADVEQLRNCAAVVVAVRAAFTNTRTDDVRMAGAGVNAPLIRSLAARFVGYQGTVLVVTNPVDLMTRLWADVSGCSRVFGVGSGLDTARYRLTLARLLDVATAEVSGHVIGEHGTAHVVCASSTAVGGRSLPIPLRQIREELTARPGRISAGIGRTRCGPAGAVLSALRLACGVEDGTVELSVPCGEAWLGVPVRFTRGRAGLSMPSLNAAEVRQLEAAGSKLCAAYRAVRSLPMQPLPSERQEPLPRTPYAWGPQTRPSPSSRPSAPSPAGRPGTSAHGGRPLKYRRRTSTAVPR
ncbi:NAD(P)-binding domain-containing protein [Streptomyces sp. NPDC048182]|uniref:lactate/malate family dehydrogenase n=1 Tax=Streptomyces sp. NPDC048182 TaxID=3365507 RepID=UPI0037185CE5